MNQFARKSGMLSLVPSATGPAESSAEARADALNERFDGWVNSVAPTLLQSKCFEGERVPNIVYLSRRPLSSTDIIRVNRATIRESSAPRPWPPEVVIRFLEAEVIKRNK